MVEVINEEHLIRELTERQRRQDGSIRVLYLTLTLLLLGMGFTCVRSAFQIPATAQNLVSLVGMESLPGITRLTINSAAFLQLASLVVTTVGLYALYRGRAEGTGLTAAAIAVALLLAGWLFITLATQVTTVGG